MFEIFKLIWDVVVLRDAARKGQLNWRTWVYGFGFVILLYGTGLPAGILYQEHPQYKPLFIAAIVFDALLFITFICWGARRYWRQLARKSTPVSEPPR
jgi:hypothetical protein